MTIQELNSLAPEQIAPGLAKIIRHVREDAGFAEELNRFLEAGSALPPVLAD